MKSVGEAMGIGRCFNEAYGKAMRSRELDRDPREGGDLVAPAWDRFDALLGRLREGEDPDALSAESSVHPWFCHELARRVGFEEDAAARGLDGLDAEALRLLKHEGVSDARIARLCRCSEEAVRARRIELGVRPVFKTVDSCGGEVAAETSYLYSSYDRIDEPLDDDRPAVLILGSGPNRIGQGIEFDYCCVQAVRSYRAQGYAAVMVNCNPRPSRPTTTRPTGSTSSRSRPRTCSRSSSARSRSASSCSSAGRRRSSSRAGSSSWACRSSARARPRSTSPRIASASATCSPSSACARRTGRSQATRRRPSRPPSASATRCSCGRPTCSAAGRCASATRPRTCARRRSPNTLVDRFVEDAVEVDVDAVGDGHDAIVAAVMEHVEEAGVHSGDSACVIPPLSIGPELEAEIRRQTELLVRGLGVQGLCNVQFALHEGTIYVLEANPRASRTVPFVCKAMGIDLVDLACRVTTGSRLAEMNVVIPEPRGVAVKEVVLPRSRASRARTRCSARRCARRARSWRSRPTSRRPTPRRCAPRAASLPERPNGHRAVAFLSVCDRDKPAATLLAQRLADLGFDLVATPGTARRIAQLGIEVTEIAKVGAEDGNSVVDLVRSGKVDLIVNTPVGRRARRRVPDPPGGDLGQGALHHDARRRERGGAGDRAGLAGGAEEPAGALSPAQRSGGVPDRACLQRSGRPRW